MYDKRCSTVKMKRGELEQACFLCPDSPSPNLRVAVSNSQAQLYTRFARSYVRSSVIFHTLCSWIKRHADGIVTYSVATAAEKNGFYNFWLIHTRHCSLPFIPGNINASSRCPFTVSLRWLRKWLVIISG